MVVVGDGREGREGEVTRSWEAFWKVDKDVPLSRPSLYFRPGQCCWTGALFATWSPGWARWWSRGRASATCSFERWKPAGRVLLEQPKNYFRQSKGPSVLQFKKVLFGCLRLLPSLGWHVMTYNDEGKRKKILKINPQIGLIRMATRMCSECEDT